VEQVLTDEEILQLRDAIHSAFRSRSSLEQMVQFQLNEALSTIAGGGSYAKILDNLVSWAQSANKAEVLIRGARASNPSNICLQAFEERYRQTRAIISGNFMTSTLRKKLIKSILKLQIVESFEGRSALIVGIPAASLGRQSTNAQVDLTMIIEGLDKLGQLQSGAWPLLILIENALAFVDEEFMLNTELRQVGDILARAYGIIWEVR
jgi:hypothetical protein